MGKKKVVEQSKEEVLKSADGVAEAVTRASVSKKSRKLEKGRIYINASYNNTIVSVTDTAGNLVTWATAGSLGFSGPKKATPFAASKIVAVVAEKVRPFGLRDVEVIVKGVGGGRDSAIRSIANQGFNILSIKDVTPIPHNGPRPKKVRRV